jgi:flavin reductase (DIM6/NTAB) family NADH-FMN oxidoreductase RutF
MNALARDHHRTSPAQEFRAAMRHLAAGVSVITAGSGSERNGLTATSVSSLSLKPPTLIVCINQQASAWPLIARHRAFGVNVLTSDQIEIGERFSGKDGLKGEARFSGAAWETRVTGVPLLTGALAAIECELEEAIERHTHLILIGRVLNVVSSQRGAALAYWQGRYVAIDQDDDAIRLAEVSLPTSRALW